MINNSILRKFLGDNLIFSTPYFLELTKISKLYRMKYIIINYHFTSLLVVGEPVSLVTLVSVVSVEIRCRNNLAACCNREYPLALV